MNKKRKKVLGWMLAWFVFLIAATSVYSYHQRQSRNLRIICCGTVSGLDSIRHEVTVNHQVFKVRNFVYQNSKLVDARHVRLNDETTVVLLPPDSRNVSLYYGKLNLEELSRWENESALGFICFGLAILAVIWGITQDCRL